jgi:hypothetical protein
VKFPAALLQISGEVLAVMLLAGRLKFDLGIFSMYRILTSCMW